MPRAPLALLFFLAACATPAGEERRGCNAEWLDASPLAATGGGGVEKSPLRIECIEEIQNRRLRLGFILPAGPDCHVLDRVEVAESAESVSISLIGAVDDDPNAGACPDASRMVITELDLAAPVDDRLVLDGSAVE
ncbi:MAG: hypothetical protein M3406_00490 [Chloroflexota bacterium]|nr:hypothetical protein [Chloroflexota bacterium]